MANKRICPVCGNAHEWLCAPVPEIEFVVFERGPRAHEMLVEQMERAMPDERGQSNG